VSSETKWIDWHPKVGDVKPDVYRYRRIGDREWLLSDSRHRSIVTEMNTLSTDYQIPAPQETSMKYWQPQIEPMSKGWTLADVPEFVRCDIVTAYGGKFVAHYDSVGNVFAGGMSVDAKPSECRVIRVIDPIPPGAMTLDKVPEGVRCVCTGNFHQRVLCRVGNNVVPVTAKGEADDDATVLTASSVTVLHILDPLPEVAYTLDTLPVGRVIEQDGEYWFKSNEVGWFCWFENIGDLDSSREPNDVQKFTVTDYLMELKEVV